MKRLKVLLFVSALLLSLSLCAQNENYKKHVDYLTSDALKGRIAGGEGERMAAAYVYRELKKYGVEMLTAEEGEGFSYLLNNGDTISSRNVYGVIPGYDPVLRNEYIVIGAHLDHLGANTLQIDGKAVEQIYRGADDNASGVAALLESAGMIASQKYLFRRSVLVAAFGAEEYGMIGSYCFLNGSFKDTSNIVMMINLDMVGRNGTDNKFRLFTGINNLPLVRLADSTAANFTGEAPVILQSDYFPSDHRNFYHRRIPVALLTTGLHRDYHSIRDTPDKIDYKQIENIANYTVALSMDIANRNGKIPFGIESYAESEKHGASREMYYIQNEVDKRAEFLHGDENAFLEKWVYRYIKYPDIAVARGEQGNVVAEFIVERDGSVSNVVITNGLSDEIDAEVKKVILASPKWKAARLHGKPVRVKTSVMVRFRLSSSSKFGIKK